MRKIEIPVEQFPDIGVAIRYTVMILATAKFNGEVAYCEIFGHKLYSDTVTEDLAFKEITGYTMRDYDRLKIAEEQLKEAEKKANEAREIINSIKEKAKKEAHQELMQKYRIPGNKGVITMPLVIEGLKFIYQNQTLSQEELTKCLLELGCTFTFEEINEQFPNKVDIYDGLCTGDLRTGAVVVANARDSEYGRSMVINEYMNLIPAFIRVVNESSNYTDENLAVPLETSGRKK